MTESRAAWHGSTLYLCIYILAASRGNAQYHRVHMCYCYSRELYYETGDAACLPACPHRKKSFSIFPAPAGMSLTKLSLGGNYDVIYKLFLPRESLLSDIPAEDGNIEKLFLRYSLLDDGDKWSEIGNCVRWGKKYFVLGRLEQPMQDKNILYTVNVDFIRFEYVVLAKY